MKHYRLNKSKFATFCAGLCVAAMWVYIEYAFLMELCKPL